MEVGHEIISTVLLSLPLIKVEQLSVNTGERMYTALVNHLGLNLLRKSVARLTDCLDMTIVVDLDVKPHSNIQTKTLKLMEPRRKHVIRGLPPGKTQIGLLSCRD